MKTRTFVSILILVLTTLIISEGFATEKKVTKRDYKFFSGTWINEEYDSHPFMAKYIIYRDGTFDAYNKTSDTGKKYIGCYEIVEKWIDSEGNIWYKMHNITGESAFNSYLLCKISDSGRIYEVVSSQDDYPTELGQNHIKYRIYYRL